MAVQTNRASGTADREIVLSRVFDAPREMVFDAFMDPKQVIQWWGPRGFTTTTQKMEVRPGGVWRFCMHGPDGRDYENRITYSKVTRPELLVFKHGGEADVEPVSHETTVTFEKVNGGTRVTMTMVFESREAREHVVKEYGAIEGGKQTMDRLGEFLATSGGETGRVFVLSRTFDAPVDLVYKAWTEKERLMEWFGPKGVTMPRASMNLTPGGVFHYCMRTPDGKEMWGKWVFREIVPRERLVVVVSFSDELGGVTRHPMAPDWPLYTLSKTTFAEYQGKTTITIRWSALNATDAERKAFEAGFDGMEKGWGGTMEQLTAYLASAKK